MEIVREEGGSGKHGERMRERVRERKFKSYFVFRNKSINEINFEKLQS